MFVWLITREDAKPGQCSRLVVVAGTADRAFALAPQTAGNEPADVWDSAQVRQIAALTWSHQNDPESVLCADVWEPPNLPALSELADLLHNEMPTADAVALLEHAVAVLDELAGRPQPRGQRRW